MILPIHTLLVATALGATVQLATASDPSAAQPATKPEATPSTGATPPAPLGKFEVKSKSSFNVPLNTRDPFWPIGWTKRAGAAPQLTQAPKATIDESAFSVTSILVGQPSLAVVNGRAYSEGEMVRPPKGSPPLRIRVQRISDGSVTLQAEDQMLVVALRRPELTAKKAEREVLNDER